MYSKVLRLSIAIIAGISLMVLQLILVPKVLGQESSSAAKVTTIPADRLEKIKLLKDRVATKVAQLKSTALLLVTGGEIAQVKENELTIRSGENDTIVRMANDVEIFLEDGKETPLKKEDVQKTGILVAVQGEKKDNFFVARRIYTRNKRDFLIGKISSLDKSAGTLLLGSSMGAITVDVERTTRISKFEARQGLTKAGFSKLTVGEIVHVFAIPTDNKNRVTAERILLLVIPSSTPSAQPSKKLQNNQSSPTPN